MAARMKEEKRMLQMMLKQRAQGNGRQATGQDEKDYRTGRKMMRKAAAVVVVVVAVVVVVVVVVAAARQPVNSAQS